MAARATPLDSDWLRSHPLPEPEQDADKNARGRVLVVGGSRIVPGGVALTAEAAFRAGAGKVQVATVASAALALGVAMPEIATFGLDEDDDGELTGDCADRVGELGKRSDAAIVGPAMSSEEGAAAATGALVGGEAALVLDAAALHGLAPHREALHRRASPAILTPHAGEMCSLLDCGHAEIAADRAGCALRAAERYGAVCVLKGSTSLIATPSGDVFAYAGGGVGLATGGSGDVMAGIAAGLAARGADPLGATMWAVWLHGEAGRRCAERQGPLGFLARELLAHVPGLMRAL